MNKRRRPSATGIFFAMGLLSIAQQAKGSETTVSGNQTTTQTLSGNSTLTITKTGSISVTGNNIRGVTASNGSNTINNSGSISTTGSSGSDAIEGSGGNTTVINSGTISTVGNGSRGIALAGNQNSITNSGTITTIDSAAIRLGTGASSSNLNSISNTGVIQTSGPGSRGIYATGNSNVITNSGSIYTTGFANGTTRSDGIFAEGNNNMITNSGIIVSNYGRSIAFSGNGNTLNLANSSFLAGEVDLGTGTQVNISTAANYSKIIDYSGTLTSLRSQGSIPVFANAVTKQLATYDPTLFAASSDALADMTGTISSLIPSRFTGSTDKNPFWLKGYGTTSSYSGTESTLSRSYLLSGVATGFDVHRKKDEVLGLFGGYSHATINTNGTTYQSFANTSDGGYLGLYATKNWGGVRVDFSLSAGAQSFSQQRYINDNLAYRGNSYANSSYQGWWVSPEAGITVDAGTINGWSFLPTARLRYATQWFGSYTESNAGSANAAINSHQISVGQTFVGLGTRKSLKTTLGKDTKIVIEGQVGYTYRGTTGSNNINVTMIGQSLSLPTEASNRNGIAVIAGVTIDLSSAVALKLRGDAGTGTGINYIGGGWAGLSIKL